MGEPISKLIPKDLLEAGEPELLTRTLAERGAINDHRTRRLREDGTEVNVSLRQTAFRDRHGRALGSCTVLRDLDDPLPHDANFSPTLDTSASGDFGTAGGKTAARGWRVCPFESDHVVVGQSLLMLDAMRAALRVADTAATVLLLGESGTGKELMARAIHRHSQRALRPFIALNCAALPEPLLESELFGHEKGAFTGAVRRRVGRFERASGGTLLLDEIGDMSLALQAKILRALEQREIERVGGEKAVPVDVRIVAATNRDPRVDIEAGRFREDLYYRLAVVVIELPPLRERGDDIGLLARHFLTLCACEYGRPTPTLSTDTLEHMERYLWPGNVRELRNAMERALLLAEDNTILPDHLPHVSATTRNGDTWTPSHTSLTSSPQTEGAGLATLDELERQHIRRVLATTHGRIGRAAEILGIHRNTLRRKLREHGLT